MPAEYHTRIRQCYIFPKTLHTLSRLTALTILEVLDISDNQISDVTEVHQLIALGVDVEFDTAVPH